MSILAANLVLLAQTDTGYAGWDISFLIGILAFPCIVIISIIWKKLKDGKESDKHIEKLQKKVADLERATAPKKRVDISESLPDYRQAKWWHKAAEQGDEAAKEGLANLKTSQENRDVQKSNLSNEAAKLNSIKPQSNQGLTKEQKAYIDEVFARAGTPSAALQRQIDEIIAAKTQDELVKLYLRDANVERPKIEAKLLCVVMCAKEAQFNMKNVQP